MKSGVVPEDFPLGRERTEEILTTFPKLKVAVVGDFHLDVYWHADMRRARLSRETPHFARPVVRERYEPGVGGVVTANLCSLGVGTVYAVGVCGDDWRGDILRRRLAEQGVALEYFVVIGGRLTPAYIKPIVQGYESAQEDPRLDFQDHRDVPAQEQELLLRKLEELVTELDGLCVCDQVEDPTGGLVTERVRNWVASVGERMPQLPVVADSRARIRHFRSVMIKVNRLEAARALGVPEAQNPGELLRQGEELFARTRRPVVLSAGSQGMGYVAGEERGFVRALPVSPPVDPVGAGDSATAGIIAACAGGASLKEGIALGNLVAACTVKKLGETGTATPEEILSLFTGPAPR